MILHIVTYITSKYIMFSLLILILLTYPELENKTMDYVLQYSVNEEFHDDLLDTNSTMYREWSQNVTYAVGTYDYHSYFN